MDEEEDRKWSFGDLAVFKRAYAISLDVHRISLEFPRREQYALADQARRAFQVRVRIDCGRFGQAARLGRGVQALSGDGDGLGGRDAGLVPLLFRPRLDRRCDVETMAGRISGDR
jgi:hypothetical protein